MNLKAKVIQTAKENAAKGAWLELADLELNENCQIKGGCVSVITDREFQTFKGFGGSFTEAAAYTWANTSKENQAEIIKAYFNKEEGLGYTIGRSTIHCCDFSLAPYCYIEDGDEELKTFDMSHDDECIIPMIKAAQEEAGQPIALLCSPWSPPPFMKTNNDYNYGGTLKKEYYATWAKYVVKYIQGMLDRGMKIDMVSVQNEPAAVQTWASCIYSPEEEAIFATDYLYKELENANLHEQVKIIIWDHNKDLVYKRVKDSFAYPGAKDAIWGIGYHWYGTDKSDNLTMVHRAFPDKHLVFTEGCVELINNSGVTSSGAGMGAWEHGETYGRNIINDLNNYNEAQLDWNLILNEEGGPNYVGNFCEAPILVDRNADKIVYNWSYYYIGQCSRYIKPNAVRISCMNDIYKDVYTTAVKNPNGEIVVIVQNEKEEAVDITLMVDDSGAYINVPAHSITTYIIEK